MRTAKAMWLELKSDDVETLRQKILDFGVRVAASTPEFLRTLDAS